MTTNLRLLRVRQLDRRLIPIMQERATLHPPRRGWIKEIREALGMTAAQLAQRMQMGQSSLSEIEKSEAEGGTTLNTLRKAADALECDLIYVLVPRRPLEEYVTERVRQKAIEQVQRVGHNMALEDQRVSDRVLNDQVEELVREMLEKPPRTLWD